ncbi:SipW-dependent-type signal peptide-containing protein [Gordonia sp. LUNF6]|uniref:SipW-dependent-type signal peptide-containing protein n=1 Tax=Gordonia sp. LUNF6 TaxID=3388658 RepID=UPI00399A0D0A
MSSSNETHDRERSGSRLRGRLGDTGWTRARAIASLGMVFGLGAVGTMAAWSDTATATTGMFSTSAVNIEMKLNGQRPNYAFAALSKINLARGATTAGVLPVQNTGSDDFKYTMKALVADAGTATYGSADAATFADNLTIEIRSGGTSDGSTCSGGTQILAPQKLSIGTVDMITAARQVNVSAADDLCIQASVSPTAPIGARMSALSINFQFAATQA